MTDWLPWKPRPLSRQPVSRRRLDALKLERNLALIFALLASLLIGLGALHWIAVVEPLLRMHATSHAQALAQAQAHRLERLFEGQPRREPKPDSDSGRLLDELTTELDAMLLLRERARSGSLIQRITLELDYDLITVERGALDLARGEPDCPDCILVEVPLYEPGRYLLIGLATFYSSTSLFQELNRDVRGKFLWFGGLMLGLIALAWLGASRLLRRLGDSEANLRTLFEAAPFPMVIRPPGAEDLAQANHAAQTYLELREVQPGHFSSPLWQTLRASGLPEYRGEQRELLLRAPDGSEQWVLVSVMPMRFSGQPAHLLSLVDVSAFKRIQQELQHASITDALTGLYNRRHLLVQLGKEIELAHAYQHPLTVLLFDLDHFKRVNDTYGHRVGDQVLAGVANVLRATVREGDIAGRYGGEEFLVILPGTATAEAARVAERLRGALADLRWPNLPLQVTLSGGIGTWQGQGIDALIEEADDKLYQAKSQGRDRIIV